MTEPQNQALKNQADAMAAINAQLATLTFETARNAGVIMAAMIQGACALAGGRPPRASDYTQRREPGVAGYQAVEEAWGDVDEMARFAVLLAGSVGDAADASVRDGVEAVARAAESDALDDADAAQAREEQEAGPESEIEGAAA